MWYPTLYKNGKDEHASRIATFSDVLQDTTRYLLVWSQIQLCNRNSCVYSRRPYGIAFHPKKKRRGPTMLPDASKWCTKGSKDNELKPESLGVTDTSKRSLSYWFPTLIAASSISYTVSASSRARVPLCDRSSERWRTADAQAAAAWSFLYNFLIAGINE